MNAELRNQAVRLRVEEEMSYTAIMKKLSVPKSTLSYWLREFPLTEEKILELRRKNWLSGEASRERYRNAMREKKRQADQNVYLEYVDQFKHLSTESCFVAGLVLYLGEGEKRNPFRVHLANTDPGVIRFFIAWIGKFYGISRRQIRLQLHLYESMDISKEVKFWENVAGIDESQFYKHQIRTLRPSSFSYSYSHGHGTCAVYVPSTGLKRKIMMAMKAMTDCYQEAIARV
ncbi:helix-turn-helix transcriptional regulator [Candidatus Uhrbacteria bacterium]|nr:helix-turn-helix transcriptional regulator [Candidatus Uhrbacteria bacterium]